METVDEPLIHSHYTDYLPKAHPRRYTTVACDHCHVMVHCGSNECMCTWIEWGAHNLCGTCFVQSQSDMQLIDYEEFKAFAQGGTSG